MEKCSQLSHGLVRLQVIHVVCISGSATVNTSLLPPGLAQSESTTASCIQCMWPELISLISLFSWLCAGRAQTNVDQAALGNRAWRHEAGVTSLGLVPVLLKLSRVAKKAEQQMPVHSPCKPSLSTRVQSCRTTARQFQFIIVPRLMNSCEI